MNLLVVLPLIFFSPVMEHATGAPPGLVLAAPHEGYDMYTGDITNRVANRIGWGRVIAKEYRDSKAKRWLDVNRPTQRLWSLGGKRGKEQTTRAGREAFAKYLGRLRTAGQVAEGPLTLLVEFHGHNRRVQVGTQKVRLDVIECASRGFSDAELRELQTRYRRLAAERWPVGPIIELHFDQLDSSYRYRGTTQRFYFRASGAKKAGSLQASVTTRALHFELPQNVRSTKTQRQAFGRLFADLLEPLSALAGEGPTNAPEPRRGAADLIPDASRD